MKLRISLLLLIVGVDTCNTVVAADPSCNDILKPDDSVDCDGGDSGGDTTKKRKFGAGMVQNAKPSMYTVKEEDNKPFACLLSSEELPICETSTKGVKGQRIIPSKHFRKGNYGYESGKSNIVQDIRIHTTGNTNVNRNDFSKWTRWYQEYGNTQIFRMHSGEYKVDSDSRGRSAGRIEAEMSEWWPATETGTSWKRYTGTFTIVKANDSTIFQVFTNGGVYWSVILDVDRFGALRYVERRGETKYVFGEGESVIRRPFTVTVCDNGEFAEIFVDGVSMSDGIPYGGPDSGWPRPDNSKTHFRWGTYVTSSNREKEENKAVDSLMFVAGSRVDDVNGQTCGPI